MTTYYKSYEAAAKKVIDRVGKKIIIGVPLGLGKPIGLLNALYRIVSQDKSLDLTIITGLTLARPLITNELEKRFVEPLLQRILGDYEDPLYEKPRLLNQLPANIQVIEFFLSPGKYLHNAYVQQNYISSIYTSVVHDAAHHGINVLAQQVSPNENHSNGYSLSCNTDLFSAMAEHLMDLQHQGKQVAIVAEVNANLPFMYGDDAVISPSVFTDIVDTENYRALFSLPHEELSPEDHLIGLYTSTLIKDDSCLQVGIGSLSIAVANALILRHRENMIYQNLLTKLNVMEKFREPIANIGEINPFKEGIYASTEMFGDEYMELYHAGVLKKQVFDNVELQKLLNDKLITDHVSPEMIDILIEKKVIHSQLTHEDILFLKNLVFFVQILIILMEI